MEGMSPVGVPSTGVFIVFPLRYQTDYSALHRPSSQGQWTAPCSPLPQLLPFCRALLSSPAMCRAGSSDNNNNTSPIRSAGWTVCRGGLVREEIIREPQGTARLHPQTEEGAPKINTDNPPTPSPDDMYPTRHMRPSTDPLSLLS